MAKKQWISVKCGLSRDPKHRQAMGESIWLFLHMLDTASWEDGIVHEWKDEAAAEDMEMPIRTLREHRRKLDELGYINCVQKKHNQDIVIHNWTNPREYSGKVYNKYEGDASVSPSEIKGYTKGYTKGSRKDVTPTLYSNIKESNTSTTTAKPNTFILYEQNIGPLTPIISDELQDLEKAYSEIWVGRAIKEATESNARNLRYIRAVLAGYKERGSPDIGRDKTRTAYPRGKRPTQPAPVLQFDAQGNLIS